MTEQSTLFADKNDIKLIVLDVDHTLLNSQSELSERNERALKAAMEKGVQVMLATGKNYGACKDLIFKLGIKTPCIFAQGLMIHEPNGAIRHQQTMDTEVVRRIITFGEDRGFAFVLYSQGRMLARANNPYINELHTRFKEVPPEYVGSLTNALNSHAVNKLIAVSPGDVKKIRALRWQLEAQLNGSARFMSGGVPHMLEILPPNASKGNALRALIKELKIQPSQVLAMGDAENDLEMIQLAGVGVAMANAEKVLKDAADYITDSYDEDGVAKAVEKFVIGEPKPAEPIVIETPAAADATPAAVPTEPKPATPAAADAAPVAPKPEDSVPTGESDE